MKKRYNIAALALTISLSLSGVVMAATGPAYPEVPVSERTSNLAENQSFVNLQTLEYGEAVRFYDMYGNCLKNAKMAGGEITTNGEGFAVWNGIVIDGINAKNDIYNYNNSIFRLMDTKEYGWRQDPEKPVCENGVSNWYYKYSTSLPNACMWFWMSDQDNIVSTKKAYCFNEYGYLYVNTITPDGFIVNECGQMITEDGTLVEHEEDAMTHDAMHSSFIGASIGFMRQKYFTVCTWPYNEETNYGCGGKCLFGYDK